MRSYILIIGLLTCLVPVFGQKGDFQDSIYYEQFKANRIENLPQAKNFALLCFEKAGESKHYLLQAKASYALGYCYRTLIMFDSSLYYYRVGIKIAQKNKFKERLVFLSNEIANVFEKIDIYDSALYYYNLSMEVASDIGDLESQAFAHNNIGLINFRIDNLPSAIDHFKSSIRIANSLKDYNVNFVNTTKTNLALAFQKGRDFKSSRSLYNELINDCGDCMTIAHGEAYYNLGVIEFEEGNISDALDKYSKALGIYEQLSDRIMVTNSYTKIATVYFQMHDMGKTRTYLEKAQASGEELKVNRVLREVYQLWSAYYQIEGDLVKSLEYKDKFIQLKDSIFHEGMSSSIRNIMLANQQKQADAIIGEKNKALERSYLIAVLASIIATLLILLFLTFYRFYNINRIAKRKLDQEVVKQTEIIKKSYEDYDHLIYRTSHDIRGPIATSLGLVNLARIESKDPVITDYLNKIESTSKSLDNRLSKLVLISSIQNKKPTLDKISISELVNEQLNKQSFRDHFPLITTHIQHDGEVIVETDEGILEFVLSTLLENAYKYYDATEKDHFITIASHVTNNRIEISVSDSGFGVGDDFSGRIFDLFVVGNENHGDGLGLFLARRAAERLGGTLTLAKARKPTTFLLSIPRGPMAINLGSLSEQA